MGLVGLKLTANIHAAFVACEKETRRTSLSTIFKYLTFFPSSIVVDTANSSHQSGLCSAFSGFPSG